MSNINAQDRRNKLRKYSILLFILLHVILCIIYRVWMIEQHELIMYRFRGGTATLQKAIMLAWNYMKVLPIFPVIILAICFICGKWKTGLIAAAGEVFIIIAYYSLFTYSYFVERDWAIILFAPSGFVLVLTVFFFFVLFKRKILQIKKVAISLPCISLTD